MKYRRVFSAACVGLTLVNPVFAQEKANQPNVTQTGLDQKLQEVYDLYRTGNVTTLSAHEKFILFGLSYAASGKNTLGIQQSSRSFGGNISFGYGVTNRVELLATVPFAWSKQEVDSMSGFSQEKSQFGISNPSLRVIASLPTQSNLQMSAIFSATAPPVGSKGVSGNAWQTEIGGNINWASEPVFAYGGLSWIRDWTNEINSVGYNAGLSLYLNDRLAIGPTISGTAVIGSGNQSHVDPTSGVVQGSHTFGARDNAMMSLQASYLYSQKVGLTATVGTGVTGNVPDMTLGVSSVIHF